MMASRTELAALMALALVSVAGLVLTSLDHTGASVSVAPTDSTLPHVVAASRVQRCLSDSYCAPGDRCDAGFCVADERPDAYPLDPVPSGVSYDQGGTPWVRHTQVGIARTKVDSRQNTKYPLGYE